MCDGQIIGVLYRDPRGNQRCQADGRKKLFSLQHDLSLDEVIVNARRLNLKVEQEEGGRIRITWPETWQALVERSGHNHAPYVIVRNEYGHCVATVTLELAGAKLAAGVKQNPELENVFLQFNSRYELIVWSIGERVAVTAWDHKITNSLQEVVMINPNNEERQQAKQTITNWLVANFGQDYLSPHLWYQE
jgi:hypothetical protein